MIQIKFIVCHQKRVHSINQHEKQNTHNLLNKTKSLAIVILFFLCFVYFSMHEINKVPLRNKSFPFLSLTIRHRPNSNGVGLVHVYLRSHQI
jgi:hypothetical protein